MVFSLLFKTSTVDLNEKDKKNMDNYTYNGGDNGVLYKAIHSPVAEFIASMLPRNLAPNVITLIAALFIVFSHILTYFSYGPQFNGFVDDWAPIFHGYLFMCYITLDNVDGKQARRTGNSSPLGQLFDHG